MKVSIALVNWNNRSFLEKCLESICQANFRFSYEIVVADNGSTDGSLEMLESQFAAVRVIRNDSNVGVARGNNQCIKISTGDYILILNNDTIVNADTVNAFVDTLDKCADAAAVGGTLLNPDGSTQATFNRFPTLREEFLIVTHLGKFINPLFPSNREAGDRVRKVDWISSACILVRRSVIEEIGFIDEDFFIYSDETDWQYRLNNAGWHVYYIPEATTIHYGGGSFRPGEKRFTLVYRGRMLFARKHYGKVYQLIQRKMFGLAAAGRLLIWMLLLLLPGRRRLARKQVRSNIETLRLTIRLK